MAQDGGPAHVLAAVLRLAPFVTAISLYTPDGPLLPRYISQTFLCITTFRPPLHRLVLDCPSSDRRSPLSYPEIYRLLHVLPHLTDLELSSIHLTSVPPPFAPQCRLQRLSLTGVTGVAAAAAFDAITRLSGPSLTNLDIDGTVTFDLSRFTSLARIGIPLPSLANEDSDARDREARRITGETVSDTLGTAAPSLREVVISDTLRKFPRTAFDDGIFFATFPRTISTLRMGGIQFKPAAALRLLERRPTEEPRIGTVVAPEHVYEDSAVGPRFDDAGVWLGCINTYDSSEESEDGDEDQGV